MLTHKQKSAGVKLKVLIVNLQGRIAGAETSLLLLLEFIKNCRFTVACPAGNKLAEKIADLDCDVNQISPPPAKSFRSLAGLLYLIRLNLQLTAIVLKTKPQIIHANSTKAALASTMPALLLRKKLIWHVRDLQRPTHAAKLCSLISKKIIAVSKTVKKSLIEQGINPSRIKIIYNGTNIKKTQPVTQRKIKNKKFVFANIGQFVPWKKQPLFIDAARLFLNKNKNAHFLLIGEDIYQRNGKYQKSLMQKIKKDFPSKKITCLKWRDNLEKLWCRIDCLIHTAENEPFGRVIIEAMAHNVIVIAANNAGPAEIIKNNKHGLLVQPDNPEKLSLAMAKIANNKQFAIKMALAGKKHVLKKFSAKKTAEQIENLYQILFAN